MNKKELELHLWKTIVPDIPGHQTNKDLQIPNYYEGLKEFIEKFNIKKEFRCAGAPWDPIFSHIISQVKPKIIIEVGSYIGYSAIKMADACKLNNLQDTSIICIDPFLDASLRTDFEAKVYGYPTVFYTFLNNIKDHNHEDIIIPLPMPALTGYRYLRDAKVKADLIYIDGSHDYDDVYLDVSRYLTLLNPGGLLFGDDWTYEGVREATQQICSEMNINPPTVINNTAVWYIQK
jgi:hypothetical protein